MPNYRAQQSCWVFPFGHIDDKVWNIPYPKIQMRLTNMDKVRTANTRMQTYYKSDDSKCFLFHKRWMQNMYICQWVLF